jgi:hypothetical protein
VLADASIDNAYLVADRLRNAFAVARRRTAFQ